MEIDEILNKPAPPPIKPLAIGVVAISVAVALAVTFGSNSREVVNASQIQTHHVLRDDLPVVVKGYGKLKSKRVRVLTASSAGTVEEVLHRPGERVDETSVVIYLANPELSLKVSEAKTVFESKKLELEEYHLTNQLNEMENQSEISQLKMEIEIQEFNLSAKKELVDKGIIALYEYKLIQSSLAKSKLLLSTLEEKANKLATINSRRYAIKREQLKQHEMNFTVQQQLLGKTRVKAGIDGILQEVVVKAGQSVQVGDKLALVGNRDELIAEISIPQRHVNLIELGDHAVLDTYGSAGKGVVKRIDPVVTDGRVIAEVELTGVMPGNARPELTVEASIAIDKIEDALFVEKSRRFAPNTTQSIFRLSDDGRSASRARVEFGQEYGAYVLIEGGLKENDQLLVMASDKVNNKLKDIDIVGIENEK